MARVEAAPEVYDGGWKLKRDTRNCEITVELPQGEGEEPKVIRNNRGYCRNTKVKVVKTYREQCFTEESIPGYLDSFNNDDSVSEDLEDDYYDPKVANPCCWAEPAQHDYRGENENRPKGRKANSKDRVPQDEFSYEEEFFPSLLKTTRSGACYDLSLLSAKDQLAIVRKILITPVKGRNKPSLDLINFTYQDQFISPPQDQNDAEQVTAYFATLKAALEEKSLDEQRLTILLAQYHSTITYWGGELKQDSLFAKSFEEFYRSSIADGEVASDIFDSDLDGKSDLKDTTPLGAIETSVQSSNDENIFKNHLWQPGAKLLGGDFTNSTSKTSPIIHEANEILMNEGVIGILYLLMSESEKMTDEERLEVLKLIEDSIVEENDFIDFIDFYASERRSNVADRRAIAILDKVCKSTLSRYLHSQEGLKLLNQEDLIGLIADDNVFDALFNNEASLNETWATLFEHRLKVLEYNKWEASDYERSGVERLTTNIIRNKGTPAQIYYALKVLKASVSPRRFNQVVRREKRNMINQIVAIRGLTHFTNNKARVLSSRLKLVRKFARGIRRE